MRVVKNTETFSMCMIGLAFWMSACVGSDGRHPDLDRYVHFPEGAVAPAGLDQIVREMSQREVLKILGPRYRITHATTADEVFGPVADSFQYMENGGLKIAEVFYDTDGRVEAIYYGSNKEHTIE